MKNWLFMVLAVFVLCSCATDYSKQVKERVAQYRKEGKWILAYSKNATAEEHYVVYADEKTQTIVIDTLEGTKTLRLNGLKEVSAMMTFADSKIVDFSEGGGQPLSVSNRKFIVPMGYDDTRQAVKLRGYKDKYMVMEMDEGCMAVLFFDNGKVYKFSSLFMSPKGRYYKGTDCKISRNGDVALRIKYDLEHNGDGLPGLLPCTYVVTLGCNGEVKKKSDHVTCCGVSVPVSAFADYIYGNLEPYVEEMKRNLNTEDLQDDEFDAIEDEGSEEMSDAVIFDDKQEDMDRQEVGNNVTKSRQVTPEEKPIQEQDDRQPWQVKEEEKVFDIVEEQPSFPGGYGALMQWLGNNMKYPVIAAENGVQGKVVVQFVVSKTGSISDVRVVRGVEPSLDKEAVRVVGSMPRWIPGRQEGQSVNVRYTLPITFKLQ